MGLDFLLLDLVRPQWSIGPACLDFTISKMVGKLETGVLTLPLEWSDTGVLTLPLEKRK